MGKGIAIAFESISVRRNRAEELKEPVVSLSVPPLRFVHHSSRPLKRCSITDAGCKTIDSCREKRILCAPKTEDSCGRCNRLQLKDCNFEVKETSQDKPASQRTARPLSILPSVEPEQGTINAWGSGTFATAMASLASQGLLTRRGGSRGMRVMY